jgi:acetylornithine deacetylase/succinyl-diaminopimelate desuccinylase-like protein
MTVKEVKDRVRGLMPRAKKELAELVAIPSVADPKQYPRKKCVDAANRVAEHFSELGFTGVELREMRDGYPAICGERKVKRGAPTVLLYAHYDVQPPLDAKAWKSPPFKLTEKSGRWFGRGAADCKGNILMHLTALRALDGTAPVNLKLIVEGAEEQGTGALEEYVEKHPREFAADAILVCDVGNFAAGVPTVTATLRGIANVDVTVRSLKSPMHSGMFGGPAPDPVAALIAMLATLRDAKGNTTVRGLSNRQKWKGVDYPAAQFRRDATVLEGVGLLGSGTVAEMLWARPAVTVLGIDVPPVVGSTAAIQASAKARLNLRVPPGMDAKKAQAALIKHLRAVAPWNVKVETEDAGLGEPFTGSLKGPAFNAMSSAMKDAFGKELTIEGQGGSIPLCNALQGAVPRAEIMLIGVEEPRCLIHAPNESVDPRELERMAVAEALFLQRFAEAKAG